MREGIQGPGRESIYRGENSMNTECEICRKSKEELTEDNQELKQIMKQFGLKSINDFSEKSKIILKLAKYTYACDCPQVLLGELCFIRDNELKLTDDDRMIMNGLKNQKKAWIHAKGLGPDTFMKTWDRAMISNKKINKTGDEYESNRIFDEEVGRIHNDLWRTVYRIKDSQ